MQFGGYDLTYYVYSIGVLHCIYYKSHLFSVSYYNLVCVGLYSKVAVGIPYNTHILWLLSITYQAGIQYNALTWLVWVSTASWLHVFRIIHLICGCLVLLHRLAFSIMLSHGLCWSVQKVGCVYLV